MQGSDNGLARPELCISGMDPEASPVNGDSKQAQPVAPSNVAREKRCEMGAARFVDVCLLAFLSLDAVDRLFSTQSKSLRLYSMRNALICTFTLLSSMLCVNGSASNEHVCEALEQVRPLAMISHATLPQFRKHSIHTCMRGWLRSLETARTPSNATRASISCTSFLLEINTYRRACPALYSP